MKGISIMIRSRLDKLAALAVALVAFTGAGVAQESLKIATVDLAKAFESYWKTALSNKQVAERRADFVKIEQGLIEDINLAREEHARLYQSSMDPANSKEKQEADTKKAIEKRRDHEGLLRRLDEYRRNRQNTMGQMSARLSRARIDEIKEVISTKAKEGSYDIVLNTAQNTANTTAVLYTVGKNDLTDSVIAELNADAPKEFEKPTAAEGAATPEAPAPAPEIKK